MNSSRGRFRWLPPRRRQPQGPRITDPPGSKKAGITNPAGSKILALQKPPVPKFLLLDSSRNKT